jgi:hypothetical protein
MSMDVVIEFCCSGKRSLAQAVEFPVVEPAHLSSSHVFDMGVCIYLDLFQDFLGTNISAVGDMPINREASVVTSSTSRSVGSVLHRCS